jgi:hypothetical protein
LVGGLSTAVAAAPAAAAGAESEHPARPPPPDSIGCSPTADTSFPPPFILPAPPQDAPDDVRALLANFYLSYFPFASRFELPPGRVNKWLHMDVRAADLAAQAAEREAVQFLAVLVGAAAVLCACCCCRKRKAKA